MDALYAVRGPSFFDNIIFNVLWLAGAFVVMLIVIGLANQFKGILLPIALYYLLYDYYQYEKWKLYSIVVMGSPLMAFIFLGIIGGVAVLAGLSRGNNNN